MRIVTPHRIVEIRSGLRRPNQTGELHVCQPLSFSLGKSKVGYFWDTKNRPQNNCVHAKLVRKTPRVAHFIDHALIKGGRSERGWEFACEGQFIGGTHAFEYLSDILLIDGTYMCITYELNTYLRDYCQTRSVDGHTEYRTWPGAYTYTIDARVYTWDGINPRIVQKSWHQLLDATVYLRSGLNQVRYARTSGHYLPEVEGQTISGSSATNEWCLTADDAYISTAESVWRSVAGWAKLAMARHVVTLRSAQEDALSVVGYSELAMPDPDFLFQERQVLVEGLMMSDHLAAYWKQWLVQHAYFEAVSSAPKMSDNSIANLAELIGFIKDLVVDHEISMPRSLQDAWLSYRYSYQTTKSDIEEAIEFVHRKFGLSELESACLHCYGQSHTVFQGTDVTCRCTLKLRPREIGLLKEVWLKLYEYGLQPNFYVFWDSLPFSFIADWFIPIGDVASVMDASANYCGETFDIKDVVFSLQYKRRDSQGREFSYYSRWQSSPLTSMNAVYWFDKPKAAGSTWNCRFLDAASLFIR